MTLQSSSNTGDGHDDWHTGIGMIKDQAGSSKHGKSRYTSRNFSFLLYCTVLYYTVCVTRLVSVLLFYYYEVISQLSILTHGGNRGEIRTVPIRKTKYLRTISIII